MKRKQTLEPIKWVGEGAGGEVPPLDIDMLQSLLTVIVRQLSYMDHYVHVTHEAGEAWIPPADHRDHQPGPEYWLG